MSPNVLLSSAGSTAALVLLFVGGLGALLFGMKILQESTEKLATGGLKKLFSKTAKSRLAGVGIGTLATMLLQSSGATTVLVVGFVNTGAMTLEQAVGYIMGANIGTTITAQLVALGGISSSFPLTEILIALTLVGVLMAMIFQKKRPKVAGIGNFLIGLGLLFLGLYVMTENMKVLISTSPTLKGVLLAQDLTASGGKDYSFASNPFFLLFLGIALTVLAQSSSAITSLLLSLSMAAGTVLCGGGNGVLYLILGTNIGSTSTALLSAIGSTTNGKRTAVIHFLFNFLGSILFFVLFLCWPSFNAMTFQRIFPDNPSEQIAMFHTFFNLFCTVIFLPLTKAFVWASEKIVPEKKKATDEEMLDPRLLNTPAFALREAVKYYHLMSETAMADLNLAVDAFLARDEGKKEAIDSKEKDVLRMSQRLSAYLVDISSQGISEEGAKKISRMQLDLADIVRLTEVADNITGYTRHEVEEDLHFSKAVEEQLRVMKEDLNIQFRQTEMIVDYPSLNLLSKTRAMENRIDNQRTMMVKSHLKRLEEGTCPPQNSNVFINLVGNLERCGDHLNFIAERSCQDLLSKVRQNASEDEPFHP